MIYVFLGTSLVLFLYSLRAVKLAPKVREAISQTRAVVAIMGAADLSDTEKEAAVQRGAIRMIGAFFSILARSAVCVLLPFGLVAMGVGAGLFHHDEAMEAAVNWYFVVGSSVVMILAAKYLW